MERQMNLRSGGIAIVKTKWIGNIRCFMHRADGRPRVTIGPNWGFSCALVILVTGITWVCVKSTMALCGLVQKSLETKGRLFVVKTPFRAGLCAASMKAAFKALTDVFFWQVNTRSTRETFAVGTRKADPDRRPASSGKIRLIASAAPVFVGTMDS